MATAKEKLLAGSRRIRAHAAKLRAAATKAGRKLTDAERDEVAAMWKKHSRVDNPDRKDDTDALDELKDEVPK